MGDDDSKETVRKIQESLHRDAKLVDQVDEVMVQGQRNVDQVIEYMTKRVAQMGNPPAVEKVPEKKGVLDRIKRWVGLK